MLFGRMFVMPGIVEYLQRYPETDVSALFLDRVVNMLEEGLDVGIRIGELPDSSLRGLGITRVLSYQIAPQLANGTLNVILQDHEPAPRPIHIVHREGRYASAKIRAFVDLMAERLRADGALQQSIPHHD